MFRMNDTVCRMAAPHVWQSWIMLLRPANVLTAIADVAAGWAISGAAHWSTLILLAAASACLYAGGIALNDVCDAERDIQERPERPIPSGAITRRAATIVSTALLALGVAFAAWAGAHAAPREWLPAPALIAFSLATAIILYDTGLSRTMIGPIIMGACRGLNLTLGITAASAATAFWWPVALLHMTYIAGVTSMAKREADASPGRAGATIALLATAATVAAWMLAARIESEAALLRMTPFLLLFAAITMPTTWKARRTPTPELIQRAVKNSVLGLLALDAAIASGFTSTGYGLAILALWPAARILAHRFSVT